MIKHTLRRCQALNRRWKILLSSLSLALFVPQSAFAWSLGGGQDRLTMGIQKAAEYLSSKPAAALGVVAIIGVGYATLALGKIPKQTAVAIVIGLGLIFGGSYIYNFIYG